MSSDSDSIAVIFGPNTDDDTFDGVFGHLTNGYVIAVNGVDMVAQDLYKGTQVGLYGFAFDDEQEGYFDPDRPVGFAWDDIHTVHIY